MIQPEGGHGDNAELGNGGIKGILSRKESVLSVAE
jgi:hypothetical protein